jgi:hypothetical protein
VSTDGPDPRVVTFNLFTLPNDGETRDGFAERLVLEARLGVRASVAMISNIVRNARSGDVGAAATREAILAYIAAHPVPAP